MPLHFKLEVEVASQSVGQSYSGTTVTPFSHNTASLHQK
jgi:hypothetical protein